MVNKQNFKVASASLNQTVMKYTDNIDNIKAAIDRAVEDNADILSLQELGLTAYTGDDYFKWIRTEQQGKEILELVQHIADYAKEKNPNLIISLGFPIFHADKSQPVKLNVGTDENPYHVDNPLYNINNRPFNAQAFITDGQIVGISAKTIQPDGPAEYEPRQFTAWPDSLGVKDITLPNGNKVPIGKVVLEVTGKDGQKLHIYHEICAEGWPGIGDDGIINTKEQQAGRYLCRLAERTDISLTINPSASKPEPKLDKADVRGVLCSSGSAITGGGYVYTNCLGLEASPTAFEGGAIYANNGEVTSSNKRYSFADVVYSSTVMALPEPQKGKAHVSVQHEFAEHEIGAKVGMEQDFDSHGKDRRMEETVRNTALWVRDYLRKSDAQGFFVSLSGGADSAFGAVMVSMAVDLNVKEFEDILGNKKEAVDRFINQYQKLKYKDEALEINEKHGPDAAIKFFKSKFLTCAYMGTDNSSFDTLNAAQTLIEGGTLPDGKKVEGIGGTFHKVNVQDIVDSYMEAFAGIVRKDVPAELRNQVREEVKEFVSGNRESFSDEVKQQIDRRVLSWANKGDDLTLQNIQARARLPMAWLFGNDEQKIACVTSNWSEAVAGYWTFGGDGHMGSINLCGGVNKSFLKETLKWLEAEGANGLNQIESLHFVNNQRPSAELRPLDKDGKIKQFDEDDMMPYPRLDLIAEHMVIMKKSPSQVFHDLKDSGKFDNKEQLANNIDRVCRMWKASQFKRYASVVAPFLGENVEPHGSLRTTILGDAMETGRAQLKLDYLLEENQGNKAALNEKLGGKDIDKLSFALRTNDGFKQIVLNTNLSELEHTIASIDMDKLRSTRTITVG